MRNRRILYIEDEPDQLEMVQVFLERSLPDVIVDVRCSVAGAEAALNSHCYDLIISDVDLPGELGTAIAARILERDPEQAIYLVSEYTGFNVRREAKRLGLKLNPKFSTADPADFLLQVKLLLAKRPCARSAALGESGDRICGPASAHVASRAIAVGEDAGSRVSDNPPIGAGSHRRDGRGDIVPIQRPRPIRLSSPHVRAARTAQGRS